MSIDRREFPTSEYRASSDDRTAAVTFSPRYAEYMNREADGSLSDRVFVSFHSNAGGGSARGVLGLYNGNNSASSATPNQVLLAEKLGREVNDDLVAQAGQFEHNWFNRSVVTLDRSDIEFGEINNAYVQNEFDATIIETGFHDNQQDAEMLRDPNVRDAIARATYQGLVRYFRLVDGVTPEVMAPPAPTEAQAIVTGSGSVTLSWTNPLANEYSGDEATSFRIYTSLDGYGFDGGTVVPGGTTTSHTLTGLDTNQVYYFKVVAENEGGQSPSSEVVAALPSGDSSKILIVNGFDRLDRTLNPRVSYPGRVVDRVRPRFSNSFDYAAQTAAAIGAYATNLTVDTVPNEAVSDGSVPLSNYQSVIWILGEESSVDMTFDTLEQARVTGYLAQGGNLFVSGSEIGWDLDQLNNGRSFYNDVLRADYVADDSNTYTVQGLAGSIFEGVNLTFDNGQLFYDVTFPDVITATSGAVNAMRYVGGSGGTAAITYDLGTVGGKIVNLGFPFETITSAAAREAVMANVLDFFEPDRSIVGDFNNDGELDCDDIGILTAAVDGGSNAAQYDLNGDEVVTFDDILFWVTNIVGTLTGDANLDGQVDVSDFNIWNSNKFTTGNNWCSGDFNGDGVTDVPDFNIWNANKFQTAAGAVVLRTFDQLLPTARELPAGKPSMLEQTKLNQMDSYVLVPRTEMNQPEKRSLRPRAQVGQRYDGDINDGRDSMAHLAADEVDQLFARI